jgi:hypothetical protein
MARMANPQRERLKEKIKEIEEQFGGDIYAILDELNRSHLKGKGHLNKEPYKDEYSLRWLIKWKESKIAYEMSVVIRVEDTGHEASIGGVWVRRHASTPLDYEGHTPTTRMRRVTNFTMQSIRDAIQAEWG